MNSLNESIVKAAFKNKDYNSIKSYTDIEFNKDLIITECCVDVPRIYTNEQGSVCLLCPKNMSVEMESSLSNAIAQGSIFDDAEEVDNTAKYIALTKLPMTAMVNKGIDAPKKIHTGISATIGNMDDDGNFKPSEADIQNGANLVNDMINHKSLNRSSGDIVDEYIGNDKHEFMGPDVNYDKSFMDDEIDSIDDITPEDTITDTDIDDSLEFRNYDGDFGFVSEKEDEPETHDDDDEDTEPDSDDNDSDTEEVKDDESETDESETEEDNDDESDEVKDTEDSRDVDTDGFDDFDFDDTDNDTYDDEESTEDTESEDDTEVDESEPIESDDSTTEDEPEVDTEDETTPEVDEESVDNLLDTDFDQEGCECKTVKESDEDVIDTSENDDESETEEDAYEDEESIQESLIITRNNINANLSNALDHLSISIPKYVENDNSTIRKILRKANLSVKLIAKLKELNQSNPKFKHTTDEDGITKRELNTSNSYSVDDMTKIDVLSTDLINMIKVLQLKKSAFKTTGDKQTIVNTSGNDQMKKDINDIPGMFKRITGEIDVVRNIIKAKLPKVTAEACVSESDDDKNPIDNNPYKNTPNGESKFEDPDNKKDLEILDEGDMYKQENVNNYRNTIQTAKDNLSKAKVHQEGFLTKKPKKLKPIPVRDLVSYITVEMNAIRTSNEQAMLSGYTCSKLDLVDFYINCIDTQDDRYVVPHSRAYLVDGQKQLNNLLTQILRIKPVNKLDRVWKLDVTYPSSSNN